VLIPFHLASSLKSLKPPSCYTLGETLRERAENGKTTLNDVKRLKKYRKNMDGDNAIILEDVWEVEQDDGGTVKDLKCCRCIEGI